MKNKIDLSSLKNELLKQELKRYRDAGKKAMKEIRVSIVSQWFGGFSPTSMNNATTYSAYSQLINDSLARVTVRSWVDPEKYNQGQRIQGWESRHHAGIDPVGFVLDLQLEQGIIGLPEKSQVSDWVNPNFHGMGISLRDAIENNSRWKDFQSIVDKYI